MKHALSFRAKLLLSFAALSLGLAGVALVLALRSAEDSARAKIVGDFRRTDAVFRRIIEARLADFAEVTAASLSDALFRSQMGRSSQSDSALGLGDSGPEVDTLTEIHGIFASADLPLFHRYPLVVIVSSDGRLIFSRAQPQAYGNSLRAVPSLKHALAGEQAASLLSGTDPSSDLLAPNGPEMYLVLARPIVTARGLVGAVLAGEPVARSLLDDAATIAAATVVMYSRGATAASGPLASIAGEAPRGEGVQEIAAPAGHYLTVTTTIPGLADEPLGRAVLIRSLSDELRPFSERLRQAAALVAALAVFLSILAALVLSRLMTRPLARLAAAAQRVGAGDLSVRVAVTSRDEIGHLANVFNEMVDGVRQRDQIKATFKHYLAPAVVEELLHHPERVNLGGEQRELSILFSDIVGFTSLSEGRGAQELVAILNEYFDEIGRVIVARGGTLGKFAGDSVMCFFGAPIRQDDHRRRALLAGLDHLRVVDALSERWQKQGRPAINCRIGINTGDVVVGNVGSRDGQDYTVIGDAVNLASRLEGANKEYRSRFMASEETLRGCEDLVTVRELDLLRVKGKANSVRVFEVLGPRQPQGMAETLCAQFGEALSAYRGRDFSGASRLFGACLRLVPGDGPSQVFMARCAAHQMTPPPADWNGVHEMTSK